MRKAALNAQDADHVLSRSRSAGKCVLAFLNPTRNFMKQISAALLSYGASGKIFHAPFLSVHPGFRLVGAWERSRLQIGLDYPKASSYESLEAILNDPAIDLVIVNTPTYTHYDYARKALEAGKHVVVEKAFTTTAAEAIALEALARTKVLVLSVFQNRRWDSDFRTVRDVMASGRTGDIHTAEFSFLRYRPGIGIKTHVEQPGPGAGLLNDLGPHLIDQAFSLFGMPQSVYADLRILRPASRVDDCFDLQLYYDGPTVRLFSSMLVREPGPAYILHGSKGSFFKRRTDRQEELLKGGARPDAEDWYTEPESDYGVLYTEEDGVLKEEPIRSSKGDYSGFYEALYQALTSGAPAPVPASGGICVMQIIEAARASYASGVRVVVGA